MENTKHNLSHDLAEVDFEALLMSVQIAYGKTMQEIKRYLDTMWQGDWDESLGKKDYSCEYREKKEKK